MKPYDFLIVGAGLYGSIFAYEMTQKGKRCLVIDKRNHIGGNCYTANVEGIHVHQYGAHIFHTGNKKVWEYVNRFARFNTFINAPIANFENALYNLPFNMNTFYQMWGVRTPKEAFEKIESQKKEIKKIPQNLEEQAISLVGKDIYEKLIKGYTEKQWGRPCTALPPFIIKRLPVRFVFNNNYFNDAYQGIPIGGYTPIFEKLLKNIEVQLNTDFFENRRYFENQAKCIVYTGPIDRFYDFRFGKLDYRSLRFENEILNMQNFQGNAVVNYTSDKIPYTRIIEHKHFAFGEQPKTVISKEFSMECQGDMEPYYPVNDEKNQRIYAQYQHLTQNETRALFGGRLAEYKYYDMHKIIEKVLNDLEDLKKKTVIR